MHLWHMAQNAIPSSAFGKHLIVDGFISDVTLQGADPPREG